jgi:hypothetical protein
MSRVIRLSLKLPSAVEVRRRVLRWTLAVGINDDATVGPALKRTIVFESFYGLDHLYCMYRASITLDR